MSRSAGSQASRPPLIVVEGSEAAFAHAQAELARAGWLLGDGWRIPVRRPDRLVLCGTVANVDDAGAVVLAALREVGVAAHARASRALIDNLCDDLRHIGRLDHRVGEPLGVPMLSTDQQRLLDMLVAGASLGEAAEALHLSRRTADRRLAEARIAFGAPSTIALLAAYGRHTR